jgi:hypothetical protein
MSASRIAPLLAVLVLAAAALVGLWTLSGPGGGPDREVEAVRPGGPLSASEEPAWPSQAPALLGPMAGERADEGAAPSSVLWPLVVELDLVRARGLPEVPGESALGSGRGARLVGRVVDAFGNGLPASVRFVAGPNAGRVLTANPAGEFGAADLYPGLHIAEVSGAGIPGSRREVLLADGREALLHIGYGRLAPVEGRVVNEDGEPVAGARVSVDGQEATTGERGFFHVPQVAGGRVLLEVEAPGYALHREELGVQAGVGVPRSGLEVVLSAGATLRLHLAEESGGVGPATAYVLPTGFAGTGNAPWQRFGPVELSPPTTVLEGLPAGPVQVRVYREGAVAVPPAAGVHLQRGQTHDLRLNLQSAPMVEGTVLRDGRLEAGARVRLSAADPLRATLNHLGQGLDFLDAAPRPLLPAVTAEAVTGRDGRFRFTDFGELSPWRLLEAISADGRARASVAVPPGPGPIEVSLGDADAGRGRLVLGLPGRHQALPVELVVQGEPRGAFPLGPDRDLEIDGLAEGTWNVRVSWWGQELLVRSGVDLVGVLRLGVELPAGAIEGQDADTWRRAGHDDPPF